MDKIYGYVNTVREEQCSRHPMENFGDALISFFNEYTNTHLETMEVKYCPRRLSDPDEVKHHQSLLFDYLPLEPDEEIEKTIEHLNNLNIITATHILKNKPDIYYEEHIYQMHINSYNDLINLMKSKSGVYISSLNLFIDKSFNLKNYDYSEIEKNIGGCKPNAANNIHVDICNNNNSLAFGKKCFHAFYCRFYFMEISEREKSLLKEIEKKLKIKFSPKRFHYYYLDKEGKIKYKKERIEL